MPSCKHNKSVQGHFISPSLPPSLPPPQINTFQCVLTSNGQRSFVFFLYADRLIQWPDQSNMVVAGFNAGDRDRAYSIPIALINGRPDLDTTSNVDMPGVWVFQVSGPEVVSEPIPTCADNINGTGVGAGFQHIHTCMYISPFQIVSRALPRFFPRCT